MGTRFFNNIILIFQLATWLDCHCVVLLLIWSTTRDWISTYRMSITIVATISVCVVRLYKEAERGTLLYRQYRYVPLLRVWFWSRFGLKMCIGFHIMVLTRVWFIPGLEVKQTNVNVFNPNWINKTENRVKHIIQVSQLILVHFWAWVLKYMWKSGNF